jgi:hypothetical protein
MSRICRGRQADTKLVWDPVTVPGSGVSSLLVGWGLYASDNVANQEPEVHCNQGHDGVKVARMTLDGLIGRCLSSQINDQEDGKS